MKILTAHAAAGAAAYAGAAERGSASLTPCCSGCVHREAGRDALEQHIAGLVTFSSGFGASVADSRLCRLHDQLVSPGDVCTQFESIAPPLGLC
ncbi:hypothetical protein LJ655_09625 [Paraburkholderia sp. MMS20-SJTN17]|uniref:Secreted protein n=1 Tax=Paraburkholderia translucens TaxID=2886945 RepID=A0ABS8KCF6_9BURK|nr:hypothetical protein [Paraburkholderia sp. MMS20-SJTN17]MCC8402149.1 hypothetical protein [Paraburkholderia sp. MMS20-SJTN17]